MSGLWSSVLLFRISPFTAVRVVGDKRCLGDVFAMIVMFMYTKGALSQQCSYFLNRLTQCSQFVLLKKDAIRAGEWRWALSNGNPWPFGGGLFGWFHLPYLFHPRLVVSTLWVPGNLHGALFTCRSQSRPIWKIDVFVTLYSIPVRLSTCGLTFRTRSDIRHRDRRVENEARGRWTTKHEAFLLTCIVYHSFWSLSFV